jgi:hypothetical protein
LYTGGVGSFLRLTGFSGPAIHWCCYNSTHFGLEIAGDVDAGELRVYPYPTNVGGTHSLKLTSGRLIVRNALVLIGGTAPQATVAVTGTGAKLILRPGSSALAVTPNAQTFGPMRIEAGSVTIKASDTLAVGGKFEAVGAKIASDTPATPAALTLTAGKSAMVGGNLTDINAAGGGRLLAYGTKCGGGNTNCVFELAQRKRAVLSLRRRAFFGKVAA